jgi:hypothetical protein
MSRHEDLSQGENVTSTGTFSLTSTRTFQSEMYSVDNSGLAGVPLTAARSGTMANWRACANVPPPIRGGTGTLGGRETKTNERC